MKTLGAFFRLMRWRNLCFILITQVLYYYCVFRPLLPDARNTLFYFSGERLFLFYMLSLASILIAAAGYIINDYFDLKIDTVNKPDRVVVDRIVKRRWAILWHLLFSLLGIAISFYISRRTGSYIIGIGNVVCVLLLFVYSTTFKKRVLSGNIIIAALTAWVIIVVYFFTGARLVDFEGWLNSGYVFDIRKLFKITLVYAGFAFVLSVVREVVKDIEDVSGDAKYDCRTMPIAWGMPASKVFVAVWMVVLIAAVCVCIFYAFQSGWRWGALYVFVLILLPMIKFLYDLKKALAAEDFHRLSNLVKLIMLTGILSMLFFLII